MQQFFVGTQVQLDVTFRNLNGGLVDPTEVTGEIRLPDQTVEALSVSQVSTGVYKANFTPTQNGLHVYRFAGTGDVIAAGESQFVAQTQFPE